jgi:uncharacterized membrane protein YdjX (TVP38/TMEM64 family)
MPTTTMTRAAITLLLILGSGSAFTTQLLTRKNAPSTNNFRQSSDTRREMMSFLDSLNIMMEDDNSHHVSSSSSLVESVGAIVSRLAQRGGPPFMALAVSISDVVPLLPTQPISVIAGALFGFPTALIAVVIGQTVATTFALLVGRQILSQKPEWMERFGGNSPKMQKALVDLGLNSDDPMTVFRTIFVARQSPVLPFSLGNYLVGAATTAPLLPTVCGTVLGCLPLNCVWVGAGAGGMTALDAMSKSGNSQVLEGLELVGALATFLVIASIGKVIWNLWKEDDGMISS